MRIPIAREGWLIIGVAALTVWVASQIHWFFMAFFLVCFVFTIMFFRDPDRRSNQPESAILSPADGKVIDIAASNRTDVFSTHTRISIFMNLFSVHVNRAPVAGTIRSLTHFPGKFLPADRPQSSDCNERMEIVMRTEFGDILIKQVAGLIARRIIPYVSPDQEALRGFRIGVIKFGSRVDLYLPPDVSIDVSIGDKVKAGLTRVAQTERKRIDYENQIAKVA